MNCISLKRSLPLEDDPQDTFSAKRRRQERKSTKLPDINDPNGIKSTSLKRRLSFEDDSTIFFQAKRECNPKATPKKDKHSMVPNDFLKGLPVLLDTDSSDSEVEFQSSQIDTTKKITKDNTNLFSFQQLKSICAGMMKQCEDRVREEYEVALTQQMAEQYDTFIKFTHDQMQRENGISTSYLT
ncbi:akirin [Drosophila subpulchrella]|uniref:akirin n=1 Tax=Drosophila subpulchrella TaxID=1486046 RepID=UPI0018A1343B|nr:akirin [Drosophila subpulchrella]